MNVILAALAGGAVVALLAAERTGSSWRRPAKMLASTGFIVVAVVAGALDSTYGRYVLVALALSWVGDLALTSAGRTAFLTGLGAFLLGHVAYVAGFQVRGIDTTALLVAGAVVAAVGAVVWRWLSPHLDAGMTGPVALYVVVIAAMAASAWGTVGSGLEVRIPIGATAFFLSDVAVARERFVAPGFVNRAWGLPVYYLGQVLLALSTG